MRNDWILDVLADLKTFAQSNGLSVLAEQLQDTALVAAGELASKGEGSTVGATGESVTARNDSGVIGRGV